MPRILVIADDLTGAAEIGGIATRYGLTVQLLRTPAPPPVDCDVVVYDTDSRLLPARTAAEKTNLYSTAAKAGAFDLIFKKTDSVLRGEPFAEIAVVAERFGRSDILFLPQNPSRDRCIVDGQYTVGGVPLHQTEFANDPLHPAETSSVVRLLRVSPGASVRCVPIEDQSSAGWVIGEATTLADVAAWTERLDPDRQLAAGGADFFDAIVQRFRRTRPKIDRHKVDRPLLYVSGTTSRSNAAFREELKSTGRFLPMPGDLYKASPTGSAEAWTADAIRVLAEHGVAMIAVGEQPSDGQADPAYVARSLTSVAVGMIQRTHVATLACEGGATAAVLCDALGWKRFIIESEIGPGIVCLRTLPRGARLIVKPGSYPWPRV